MTDVPTFEPGSAAELAWAKGLLRNQRSSRTVVSGAAIIRVARRIVRDADGGVGHSPSTVRPA